MPATDCDPATLVKAAACFKCVPPGMQNEVLMYLLCQILQAETGQSSNMNYGFISAFGAGPFINVTVPNTYTPVTSYVASLVSGTVTVDKVAGTITIGTAGNYRVSFSLSSTGASNDQMEVDVAINGVPSDVIAAHGASASNVNARADCMAGAGILALQAGAVLSIMAKNINSTTMTISHAQLSVGTP